MKKVLFLLGMGLLSFGQQSSTIYQQVVVGNKPCVNNVCTGTILPLPFASSNMRAIGQANHAVSVSLTNAPAKVCIGGVVDWGMEYSFDNSTFTRFGDQTTTLNINADGQYTIVDNAYGAYPYVRLKVRTFDSVNCILTASYSGVVAGQATISLTATGVTVTNTPNVNVVNPSGLATNYDTGMTVVPNTLGVVTATVTLVNNIWCNNVSANAVTLNITDTAGNYIVGGATPFSFPGGSNGMLFNSVKGLKFTGLKWIAGTSSALYCDIGGLQ